MFFIFVVYVCIEINSITMIMECTLLLTKAAYYAAEKHKTQPRKSDDSPYINHPLGVAHLLTSVGGVSNAVTLAAAMLHDVVEDTGTPIEDIQREFGNEVASIVAEVTDNKKLGKVERKKLQVEHAPQKSHAAKLVKLADKLYNLTELLKQQPRGWSVGITMGYFIWAKAVIDGMRGTNKALEEALDKVFAATFTYQGTSYPVIKEEDFAASLEHYYHLLEQEEYRAHKLALILQAAEASKEERINQLCQMNSC